MQNHRNIDLHLLACLDALLTDCQVTRAAERMNMSQPGMSNALGRLRQAFKDPLLVRTAEGMVPTQRGLELRALVRAALGHIDAALADPGNFDPSLSEVIYQVAISDYVSLLLMPSLIRHLLAESPKAKITTTMSDAKRFRDWLAKGEGHLTIGYFSDLTDGMHSTDLLTDEMCCIARSNHPKIRGRISLKQYSECAHVFMTGAYEPATFETATDKALHELGIERHTVVRIPNLLVIPAMVANSDAIATLPRKAASIYADAMSLQVLKLPLRVPDYRLSMVWHERTHHDNGQRWLREKIRNVAHTLTPSLSGMAVIRDARDVSCDAVLDYSPRPVSQTSQ
jgi:DNA-binding transcriptional LysR family regulator